MSILQNSIRRAFASLLTLALGWPIGGALAVEREDLRFYAPFEGDLQPRIAGANTEIRFVKGTAQDVQWVEGRRGRGLRVTPELTLQYVTRESFAAREGTLAFWLKPVGWSGVNHLRYFLIARSDQVALHFYMYYGNPWFYIAGPTRYDLVGGPSWQFAFEKEPFPEGQWTFIAGTYKPGQQAFYINGKLIVRRTDGLIEPEFVKTGVVEIPAGDQVLDEVMVFGRVLTEQEIRGVYQGNLPPTP
jgi:hypothetical protein